MFTNRFIPILAAFSVLLVTLAVSQPFSKPPKTGDLSQPSRSLFVPYVMDSATRSYIAWGEALEKAKLNELDSGTRSYIAWAEALETAAKLGESGVCSTTSQEDISAGIDSSLDSATRSYIGWGLALQAKNDNGALCR